MILRRFSLVLVIVFSAITACASADQSTAVERRAVLKALDSWKQGWKKKDATLAVADYAEDADWTNAFGDRFKNRADLLKGLEFIFNLDFVMAGNSSDDGYQEVTFLTNNVALVRSQVLRKGQLTGTGQTMRDREINHLRVLHKNDGRWLIVSHLISQAKEKGSR